MEPASETRNRLASPLNKSQGWIPASDQDKGTRTIRSANDRTNKDSPSTKDRMMAQNRQSTEEAVRSILRHIGEDPDREGLARTPFRVVQAFEFLTQGYD